MAVVKTKKEKAQKVCRKNKTKFENYKNYLESIQLESKINHLEKNKIDIDSSFLLSQKKT